MPLCHVTRLKPSTRQHLSSDIVDLALRSVPQAMAVKIDANGSSPVLIRLRCSVAAPNLDAPHEAWLITYIVGRRENVKNKREFEGK